MPLTTFADHGALHSVLEVNVDSEWTAVYHLALQESRVVVAAFYLHPKNRSLAVAFREPGTWDEAGKGLSATAPSGGLTARLLRQVRVGDHVQWGREVFRQMRPWRRMTRRLRKEMAAILMSEQGGAPAPSRPDHPATPRRGRRPISADVLLRVAAPYADAVARKSRQPVEDVAKLLREPKERISNLVHLARLPRHNLLTQAFQGRAGGQLTDHALAVLTRQKRAARARRRK